MASRQVLGWLGLLAGAVAVAGCTASSTSGPAAPGHGRSASPAATARLPLPPAATSSTYAVTISIPVGWQPTPNYTGHPNGSAVHK